MELNIFMIYAFFIHFNVHFSDVLDILTIFFFQIRQKAGDCAALGWDDPRPRHFPAQRLPVVFAS